MYWISYLSAFLVLYYNKHAYLLDKLEEVGLIGSSYFSLWHKTNPAQYLIIHNMIYSKQFLINI